MRVLVVGSGGREHALCWALAASPQCEALFCAPGNAGIARVARCLPMGVDQIDDLIDFAVVEGIGLVVVGPEAPLVAGLVDRLETAGIPAFGPSAGAAMLEGSKVFMKDLCIAAGIPTARFARFTDPSAATEYLRGQPLPIVIKADGLAAGKGVTVAHHLDDALAAVNAALVEDRFGSAGRQIVIEEFLAGEEVSFFALVDGTTALPLASAQDHKAAFDGDAGPNTGGMGAYSPAPILTPDLEARVMAEIIRPTVAAMQAAGRPFKGVLFAGLMIVPGPGGPRPVLLEYNVRFGDPECQVLMARLQSDLLPALVAARNGTLDQTPLAWRPEAALTVVLAARGYPGAYRKGTEIRNLAEAEQEPGVTVFHSGTVPGPKGALLAQGGRVLTVTALAPDVAEAQRRAYRAVDRIDWPDGFCRRDIGWRALARP